MRLVLALAVLLVAAPPALAAPAEIRAVDGATDPENRWDPAAVTVNAGETVTWRFDTVASHNVKATSANWTFVTPYTKTGTVTYKFDAPGFYDFVCELHASMTGRVTVGDPPPPPPPPLSEQPFDNDQAAPVLDTTPPALSGVRVSGKRVRFKLSERANVVVRVLRGKRTVARRSLSRGAGTHSLKVGGLRAGSYRIEVRATDLGGNRSPLRTARLMLR